MSTNSGIGSSHPLAFAYAQCSAEGPRSSFTPPAALCCKLDIATHNTLTRDVDEALTNSVEQIRAFNEYNDKGVDAINRKDRVIFFDFGQQGSWALES